MSSSQRDAPPPPPSKTQLLRQTFWDLGKLLIALGRRPLVWLSGIVVCGVALLLETALGQSGQALFNLVSYIPFLGGGWAVLAYFTPTTQKAPSDLPRLKRMLKSHLPNRWQLFYFFSAVLVVLTLSGLARITLTIIGELAVKTAFCLGPTVALADQAWPPASLWRGLMVVDEHPREFGILVLISAGILLLTVFAAPSGLPLMLGASGGGIFVQGIARGLGWTIISSLWMRFYLLVRVPA